MNTLALQQQVQGYINQFVEGVVVEVHDTAIYSGGVQLIAGYNNNKIDLSIEGLKQTADKLGLDIEDSAIISATHELGHHIAGHHGPFTVSNVDLVKMEIEAWMQGRQIALLVSKEIPSFITYYDRDNVNNLRNYIFTNGLFELESDQESIWSDCLRAMTNIKNDMESAK